MVRVVKIFIRILVTVEQTFVIKATERRLTSSSSSVGNRTCGKPRFNATNEEKR